MHRLTFFLRYPPQRPKPKHRKKFFTDEEIRIARSLYKLDTVYFPVIEKTEGKYTVWMELLIRKTEIISGNPQTSPCPLTSLISLSPTFAQCHRKFYKIVSTPSKHQK